jgi:hypothetical protein
MNNTNESSEVEVRKLLLDFYSSELGTHSNLIIGLALVLFAILQIPKLLQNVTDICNPQTWIFIFTIWIISGSLWYFLMRHFSYGILCNSVVSVVLDGETNPLLVAGKVRDHAYTSKVLGFPSKYFITGKNDVKYLGWVICYGVFGTLTTIFLMLLIGILI